MDPVYTLARLRRGRSRARHDSSPLCRAPRPPRHGRAVSGVCTRTPDEGVPTQSVAILPEPEVPGFAVPWRRRIPVERIGSQRRVVAGDSVEARPT